MNKNNRLSRRNYFQITEDPSLPLASHNKTTGLQVKLPPHPHHFFIDFMDECSLKLMSKVTNRSKDFLNPLVIEQYGRNIITNIEDTSPRGQKLAKYQQQQKVMGIRKNRIRIRLKEQFRKVKQSSRSQSTYAVKQNTLDYYNSPVSIDHNYEKDRLAAFTIQSKRQTSQTLRRLGLTFDDG